MHRYLSRISDLSLSSIFKIFTKPQMVPARLFAPPDMDPISAATAILPELDRDAARRIHAELLGDHMFFDALNRSMFAVRGRRLGLRPWNEFVYILVRALEPEVMIETGVFDGLSSATTLLALKRNQKGELISIDLPAVEEITGSTNCMQETALPPGRKPGWLIPENLRDQHRLELGDARLLLPKILQTYSHIDIFMHDSLHTFDHMEFEYRTSWPKVRERGFLMSDDLNWNHAFHKFAAEQKRRYVVVSGFGALRK